MTILKEIKKKGGNESSYRKNENNKVFQQEESHPSREGVYTAVFLKYLYTFINSF